MDLCQINKGNSSLPADIIKVKQKLDNSNYNDKKIIAIKIWIILRGTQIILECEIM